MSLLGVNESLFHLNKRELATVSVDSRLVEKPSSSKSMKRLATRWRSFIPVGLGKGVLLPEYFTVA